MTFKGFMIWLIMIAICLCLILYVPFINKGVQLILGIEPNQVNYHITVYNNDGTIRAEYDARNTAENSNGTLTITTYPELEKFTIKGDYKIVGVD